MRRFISFFIAALAFALCCPAVLPGMPRLGPSMEKFSILQTAASQGATVALVDDATGFQYEQTTDSVGRFAFELLPPGKYSARVTADGMSPQLSQNLRANVGGAAEVEFKLAIAGARGECNGFRGAATRGNATPRPDSP